MESAPEPIGGDASFCTFVVSFFTALSAIRGDLDPQFLDESLYFLFVHEMSVSSKDTMYPTIPVVWMLVAYGEDFLLKQRIWILLCEFLLPIQVGGLWNV